MRKGLLVILLSSLAWATPYERKASETDKPAVFGYMISDFFHQRYASGPGPVWQAAGVLLVLDLVLLADLARRRGWRR